MAIKVSDLDNGKGKINAQGKKSVKKKIPRTVTGSDFVRRQP